MMARAVRLPSRRAPQAEEQQYHRRSRQVKGAPGRCRLWRAEPIGGGISPSDCQLICRDSHQPIGRAGTNPPLPVPGAGVEPATFGLQNRCSTN